MHNEYNIKISETLSPFVQYGAKRNERGQHRHLSAPNEEKKE